MRAVTDVCKLACQHALHADLVCSVKRTLPCRRTQRRLRINGEVRAACAGGLSSFALSGLLVTGAQIRRISRRSVASEPVQSQSNSSEDDDQVLSALFRWVNGGGSDEMTFEEFEVLAEYCGACLGESSASEAELRFVFQEADTDRNGMLSKAEVSKILNRLEFIGHCASVQEVGVQQPQAGHGGRHIFACIRRRWRSSRKMSAELWQGMRLLRRQSRLAWRIGMGGDFRGTSAASAERRAVMRRAILDLAKLLPFMLMNLTLPGASMLSLFLIRRCPRLVPSSFARARAAQLSLSEAGPRGVNEFDELCVRTFACLVREVRRSSDVDHRSFETNMCHGLLLTEHPLFNKRRNAVRVFRSNFSRAS